MGITHLVFTGIVTEGCVELSARDAADRGYTVSLVHDACTSSTIELHENALVRMTDGGFIASRSTEEGARNWKTRNHPQPINRRRSRRPPAKEYENQWLKAH